MNEITIRLTDNEYRDYVKKGQSMYSKRMRRKITDEEYTRWVFLLGEYYKGQCLSENVPWSYYSSAIQDLI